MLRTNGQAVSTMFALRSRLFGQKFCKGTYLAVSREKQISFVSVRLE